MRLRIIDLSIAIENDLPSDPPAQIPKVEYLKHSDTAEMMTQYFDGLIEVSDLPEGNGWAIENVILTTHSGTHLDAPYHYYPTQNHGEPAWTIDEIPLEWCIGDGVKIDMSTKPHGYKVRSRDLQEYLDRVGHTLKEKDIVLLQSGAAPFWGQKEYLISGVGMSAEATRWLIKQGVRVMGTDAWSWDVPLLLQAKEFARNRDSSIIWEGHRVGREKAYCHLEKLTNLDQLPVSGYQVICLPVKIKKASAGWCRTVAIIKE